MNLGFCAGNAGTTEIRRASNYKYPQHESVHWWRSLKPENRCVVRWTSFCEYADTKPRKTPTWFAFDEIRTFAVCAGIWTTWQGASGTKANPVASEHQLFGSLTTEANDVVGDIHPKAMPVILMTEGITVRRKSRARFFSGIGPKQTCADALHLSALRHKGDIAVKGHSRRLVGREVSVVEVLGENHSRKSYTDK